MFSLTQILICAVTAGVVSLGAGLLAGRWLKGNAPVRPTDAVLGALVVTLSVLVWREAGNTGLLNDDPVPLVSPNDVLCPVVTYVCLGLLAAFRPGLQGANWARLRAVLTLIVLVVNVVTI